MQLQSLTNKNSFLALSCLLLVVSSSVILIGAPKVVEIAQANINFLGNQPLPPQPQPKDNVAGIATRSVIEIISANILPPHFSSSAVLALDFESDEVLFNKNIHTRLSPASTTKIMTALVAEQHFKPGDILTVVPQSLVEGSRMGVGVGERLSFRSLLYGMLLNSGNDAAYTIALNYPGGFDSFIAKMNEKAVELGLTNTHFKNPAGFDDPQHYSSAFDLAEIAKAAMASPQIARVVSTKDTQILSIDKSKSHNLRNLNQLLSEEGVIGIKTGFTEIAGENFVGLVDRNGHKILTVVLASRDRFGETKRLIDWVYSNFTWRQSFASL